MRRAELEHLVRAAAAITNRHEIVVIGSKSILGSCPNVPEDFLFSQGACLYLLEDPDLRDVIDGSIGEGSPFHERFGYYAQGVDEKTAVLPAGWKERLVRIQNANTGFRVGLCLDPHDLAASRLFAARPKDLEFVRCMIHHVLVDHDVLYERVELLPVSNAVRDAVKQRFDGLLAQISRDGDSSPLP